MQRKRLCREQAVLGAHADEVVVGVADVEGGGWGGRGRGGVEV